MVRCRAVVAAACLVFLANYAHAQCITCAPSSCNAAGDAVSSTSSTFPLRSNRGYGAPGKRGPPGFKGEPGQSFSGDSNGFQQQFIALQQQVNEMKAKQDQCEDRLKANDDRYKRIEEFLAYFNSPQHCLDIYPRKNGFYNVAATTDDHSNQRDVYCDFSKSFDEMETPKSCADVQRRENGYYHVKPTEEVQPIRVFCHFQPNSVNQLALSCEDVYPKTSGLYLIRPSDEVSSVQVFCQFDENGGQIIQLPSSCQDLYPKVNGFQTIKLHKTSEKTNVFCNFSPYADDLQLPQACSDVPVKSNGYHHIKPSEESDKLLWSCSYVANSVVQQLPKSCSDAFPRENGYFKIKPDLNELPMTVYCTFIGKLVKSSLPKSCHDVHPKLSGYHLVKPSESEPLEWFCNFDTEAANLELPKSCNDVFSRLNKYHLVKPSENSEPLEWFCNFEAKPGPVGYPMNCSEKYPQTNGVTEIMLKGKTQPTQVTCEYFQDKVVTEIHHDSESETEVSNCDPKRCYQHALTYQTELSDIVTIIDQSEECEQYIKYKCYNSVLRLYHKANSYGGWVSRDGVIRTYWGGASPQQDGYCRCGVEGNCVDGKQCNCDMNDNNWRTDDGLLTYKPHLPVLKVAFGDAHTNEYGRHTVGPLKCSVPK